MLPALQTEKDRRNKQKPIKQAKANREASRLKRKNEAQARGEHGVVASRPHATAPRGLPRTPPEIDACGKGQVHFR